MFLETLEALARLGPYFRILTVARPLQLTPNPTIALGLPSPVHLTHLYGLSGLSGYLSQLNNVCSEELILEQRLPLMLWNIIITYYYFSPQ